MNAVCPWLRVARGPPALQETKALQYQSTQTLTVPALCASTQPYRTAVIGSPACWLSTNACVVLPGARTPCLQAHAHAVALKTPYILCTPRPAPRPAACLAPHPALACTCLSHAHTPALKSPNTLCTRRPTALRLEPSCLHVRACYTVVALVTPYPYVRPCGPCAPPRPAPPSTLIRPPCAPTTQ